MVKLFTDNLKKKKKKKSYSVIRHFEINVLNLQTSQIKVSKFLNISLNGTALEFAVKS
jgi:hypothetical protein